MTNTPSGSSVSIMRLILVPSLITLGVTILRLVGELQHWSPILFKPSPGGAGAIVGIAWLPFIFGPYFALKLSDAGAGPPTGPGKAIGYDILGLVLIVAGGFLAFNPNVTFPGKLIIGLLIVAAGAVLPFIGWPALAKTLLAYGYAARIPVAIVMFLAIQGRWGTHYDVLPPNYQDSGFWRTYAQIALLPQLVFWVLYTVLVGSLFGSIVTAVARRGRPVPQAA